MESPQIKSVKGNCVSDALPASRPRRWKAIAAMSQNRVIGKNGGIPWNIPEDFKWVKQCTRDQVIAMGRNTFESIGRPLPHRTNIVITRSLTEIPGCVVLPSLDSLDSYQTDREIWIFGGAEIYRQALPSVTDLYLTVVKQEVEGDTFFPPFEERFDLKEILRSGEQFEIRHYVAKN